MPGTFIVPHSDSCKKCPKGFWADRYGATDCSRCPSERPFTTPGATSEDDCTSTDWQQTYWNIGIGIVFLIVVVIFVAGAAANAGAPPKEKLHKC
jgi:hypothetical protein